MARGPARRQGSHRTPYLFAEANRDWNFIQKGKAILLKDWETDKFLATLCKHM